MNQQIFQLHLTLAKSWNNVWPYIQHIIEERVVLDCMLHVFVYLCITQVKIDPTRCHGSLKFISWLIELQHVSGTTMTIIRRTILSMTACGICLVVLAVLTAELQRVISHNITRTVLTNTGLKSFCIYWKLQINTYLISWLVTCYKD